MVNRATEARLVNGSGELKTDDTHHDEAKAQQASKCDRFTEEQNAHSSYQGRPETRPDRICDTDIDRLEHVSEQDKRESVEANYCHRGAGPREAVGKLEARSAGYFGRDRPD